MTWKGDPRITKNELEGSLPHHSARVFVLANTQKSRVAEFVVFGPLDETDLHHDLRVDPVSAEAIADFGSR